MLGNETKVAPLGKTILENYIDLTSQPWIYREARSLHSLFQSNARLWMSIILMTTDLLALCTALLIAIPFRRMLPVLMDARYDRIFIVLTVLLAVLFFRRGLYPGVGMHYVDELRHIVTSSALGFLVMIAVAFLFQIYVLAPILVLAGVLSAFLIPFGRYIVRRKLIQRNLWGEPAAIIGDPQKARSLMDYFTVNMQFGIRPVAVLTDQLYASNQQTICPSLPVCRIKLLAHNLSLKTALILVEDLNDIDRLVERYRFVFQRVILIKGQSTSYGLSSLKSLDFLNLVGLQVKNDLLAVSSQISKRIADLVGSFLGILLLSPIFVLVALLIKLDSRGDVFYRQPRLGRNGRLFQMLKFRTMQANADQIFKDALARDSDLKKEWDAFQKLKKDPRVTRVGSFLRKFSLDELPQLWNVWKGEMSLAGPRPIMVDQRKMYGESIKLYIRVAPGMTGLWQISGRNETTFTSRAALDMEYIQRWSHWLDIYVLFKTIKVVFWNKGAY